MKHTSPTSAKQYVSTQIDSPVGELLLIGSEDGLAAILWEHEQRRPLRYNVVAESPDHPVLIEAARQLDEYFAGVRKSFDLTLDFVGTDFQRRVWAALLTIPYGETRSYGDIAAQIGQPTAGRAVGAANGRNPISIVAPCHRVIGSNGTLTGFGGGLPAKEFLLTLEGAYTEAMGL